MKVGQRQFKRAERDNSHTHKAQFILRPPHRIIFFSQEL